MRTTHTIDVSGVPLGRVATRIATLLRGKHKPEFEPHLDRGDAVHVIGIKNIKLTGRKVSQKVYHSYSGYPGGLKTKKLSHIMDAKPGEALSRAVYQMLPPTRLRKEMMKRLIIENPS
ncbi:50S ribosomal protein L13 [Candidatus Uhrbacteria bacterium]|nr:50S ribosomal protein L13 [Candidatus Uhrbacteria bacterium]